jgi:hypothetical protein
MEQISRQQCEESLPWLLRLVPLPDCFPQSWFGPGCMEFFLENVSLESLLKETRARLSGCVGRLDREKQLCSTATSMRVKRRASGTSLMNPMGMSPPSFIIWAAPQGSWYLAVPPISRCLPRNSFQVSQYLRGVSSKSYASRSRRHAPSCSTITRKYGRRHCSTKCSVPLLIP